MISLLIEAALRALVVACAVGVGLRLLRVRNVQAQKVAWGLVLAASLAMPAMMRWRWLPSSAQIHLVVPSWLHRAHSTAVHPSAFGMENVRTLVAREASTSAVRASKPDGLQKPIGGTRYPAPVVSSGESSVRAGEGGKVETFEPQTAGGGRAGGFWRRFAGEVAHLWPVRAGVIAALMYGVVCVLLLLRLIYGLMAAAKLWFDAKRVEPGMIANIAAGVRLRSSAAVFSPVNLGSGVLLPEDFAEWDAEKLRIVLAHERSHIRQGDFYLQMLAGVYAAVFWFSPLGWWLKRQLSDLGEAISDRAGLEEAASRAAYAQVLLEFAALPRPTLTGVAMARTTNLSHRVERLLNDTIFHQSFAASRRALLVGLFFPLALIAATSMVRVEAAGQAAPPAPAPAPATAPAPAPVVPEAPLAGVSNPDAAPAPAAAPSAVPMPPAAPDAAPPAPDVAPPAPVPSVPVPPAPGPYGELRDQADVQDGTVTHTNDKNGHHLSTSVGPGYSYSYSSNGDSWAVVTGPDQHIGFSGDWNDGTRAEIEKARKLIHGKFLWFTRGGKAYVIDDPAVVARIQEMYKPMEELGRQQEELGRQQEKLGQEQEQLAKEQEQTRVPTPDMSREIAEVDAAMAKLKAEKSAQVSQEELAEIQGKLAGLQGRLGEIQGHIGDKMGAVGDKQGHLGELQGKLGEQQGRLGEQQGRLAEEADKKVKSIIDQSVGSGKAKPVE